MASLKDLLVTGTARILGKIYASSFVGNLIGNADSATKATKDSANQQINTTYVKGLSVSGQTITITKGDNTTSTIKTQDTNTTYGTGNASTAGITKLYTGTGTATDGTMTQAAIKSALDGKANSSHTHSYAGSGSAGGSANSAVKLDSSAGNANTPVYFSGGKPVALGYTIATSVPANAKFTDTNTWRGIQDNLTSTAKDQSLSANQGKVLKGLVDGKAASSHGHGTASASANGFMSSTDKAKLDFGDIVYVSKTAPTKACIWVKLD